MIPKASHEQLNAIGIIAAQMVSPGDTVVVAGEEKVVTRLGTHFPLFVEVIEFARPVVARKLRSMGANVTQRTNPDGSPFLTDNGNPYLHAAFPPPPSDFPAFRDPAAFD